MVEIYKSEGKHPKTYLVEDINYLNIKGAYDNKKWMDFISYSTKYFKVRPNRLFMTSLWGWPRPPPHAWWSTAPRMGSVGPRTERRSSSVPVPAEKIRR